MGRSAVAKELDPRALRLAVVAHFPQEHTEYDRLLMESNDREVSWQEVALDIERVLLRWPSPGS